MGELVDKSGGGVFGPSDNVRAARGVFVKRGGRKADFRAGRGRLHYNLTFNRKIFRVQKANGQSEKS